MTETAEHDLKKARRNGAILELNRLGILLDSGSGVTTEELEDMLSVFGGRSGPDVPLLVKRARDRAAGAAIDAASYVRHGCYREARELLAEASHHLHTAEQRESEER